MQHYEAPLTNEVYRITNQVLFLSDSPDEISNAFAPGQRKSEEELGFTNIILNDSDSLIDLIDQMYASKILPLGIIIDSSDFELFLDYLDTKGVEIPCIITREVTKYPLEISRNITYTQLLYPGLLYIPHQRDILNQFLTNTVHSFGLLRNCFKEVVPWNKKNVYEQIWSKPFFLAQNDFFLSTEDKFALELRETCLTIGKILTAKVWNELPTEASKRLELFNLLTNKLTLLTDQGITEDAEVSDPPKPIEYYHNPLKLVTYVAGQLVALKKDIEENGIPTIDRQLLRNFEESRIEWMLTPGISESEQPFLIDMKSLHDNPKRWLKYTVYANMASIFLAGKMEDPFRKFQI